MPALFWETKKCYKSSGWIHYYFQLKNITEALCFSENFCVHRAACNGLLIIVLLVELNCREMRQHTT